MNKRILSAISIVLLGVMAFSFVGDVQTVAASNICSAASFVADLSIPDGTYINPGAPFTKIWRLKNAGRCSWSTSYSLVFSSGERMNGASPIFMPKFVSPGQSIDLSVDLTAPTAGGTYRGYWMLADANGSRFGIGGAAASPFWVQIRVLGSTIPAVAYDFVANVCSAQWVYDGGPISCPVNNNKRDLGFVEVLANPTLETGQAAGVPGLLTVPTNKFNGLIQGYFPVDDVFRGDHFQALVGCQYGAFNCAVTYQLDYQFGDTTITLWKFKEQYDGLYYQVDIDLSPVANRKDAKIVLGVFAAGPASGDQALWVAPRIVRNVQAPITTPTPIPPTPTPVPPTPGGPTATPGGVACTDRAAFVSDVTVPDGTLFAARTNFTKTWRLSNVGTCTWTTDYKLAYVSGEKMSGVDTPLSRVLVPGDTGDFSVNLTAPAVAGSYRGFWELRNPAGKLFGIGTNAANAFWVDIKVSGTLPTATNLPATATNTSVPKTATPTATGVPKTATPTATKVPPTATPTATKVTGGGGFYQDTKYGFGFQIPNGATISSISDNTGRVDLPFAPGTNLVEKFLAVNVVEGAATCRSPYGGTQSPPNAVNATINGIQFLKETVSEGAVGNQYDWTAYSTVKGTACISLTFILHSLNPGAMATPLPVFDMAAESAVISTIMSSYNNQ